MNEKLLEQLRLAKEAGTKAMAKDFFAPTPGAGEEVGAAGAPGGEAMHEGNEPMPEAAAEGELTPEQLEELMRMLESQGGGAP